MAYQDDGIQKVCWVDNECKELDHINVTEMLGLDDLSKPITGFSEPMICCNFVDNDVIVNLYHRISKMHYHFKYSFLNKEMLSPIFNTEIMNCTPRNFPIEVFYSLIKEEVHIFYRQGQCISFPVDDPEKFTQDKIINQPLGDMYLIYDEVVVSKGSNSILFFKMVEGKWTLYTELEGLRGTVFFCRGNKRIQVVCDDKIYFVLIDKETFMPTIENVMYNFMKCD